MKIDPVIMDTEGSRWDLGCEDEHLWWPRALWIDPGKVSGLAVVWFDPGALYAGIPTPRCVLAWQESYVHGPEDDQTVQIMRVVRDLGGASGLAVGCETFVMMQMNQSREFLSPVRLRAKIEYGLYRGLKEHDGMFRRRQLNAQSPSEALSVITDQRLKLWNMYTPGPDHIRDATRHCLLWMRKLRDHGTLGLRRTHGYEEGWFE